MGQSKKAQRKWNSTNSTAGKHATIFDKNLLFLLDLHALTIWKIIFEQIEKKINPKMICYSLAASSKNKNYCQILKKIINCNKVNRYCMTYYRSTYASTCRSMRIFFCLIKKSKIVNINRKCKTYNRSAYASICWSMRKHELSN